LAPPRAALAPSIRWRLVRCSCCWRWHARRVPARHAARLSGGWQGYARPLVADYVDRLAAEIGSPPDAARAQALVAAAADPVRIDGPRGAVRLAPAGRAGRHGGRRPATRTMARAGWGLVRSTADGHRISFGLAARRRGGAAAPGPAGCTLAALLAADGAGLCHVAVRRLLAPLDDIGARRGERFGRGDFDTPIATPRDDELGDWPSASTRMAASLQRHAGRQARAAAGDQPRAAQPADARAR
jgi:HAMP domain-containing protein